MAFFKTTSVFSFRPFKKTRSQRLRNGLSSVAHASRDIQDVVWVGGAAAAVTGIIVSDVASIIGGRDETRRPVADMTGNKDTEVKAASQVETALTETVSELNGMMKFMTDAMKQDMERVKEREAKAEAEAEAEAIPAPTSAQEEPEAVKREPEPAPVQPKQAKKSPKKS